MSDAGGLPPRTRIGRVGLRVADLEGLASFYETVVGLRVVERTDERAVLGAGETPLLVLLGDSGARTRPENAAGLFHVAVRVPSRAALGAALDRIERHARLTGASDHGVSEALYLRDPEGNGVEIYRDRPRETWVETADGRVDIVTEPLAHDPIRASSDGATAVPADTDVGHVHFEVSDLGASRSFYGDALGLRVRQAMRGACFLAADDYHHHLALNDWNGRTAPADGRGHDWTEFLVPDAAAVDALGSRLRSRAVEVTARDDGIAFRDPDGIGLRVRARGA